MDESADFDDAVEDVILACSALRGPLEEYASAWREQHGCPAPEGKPVTADLCRGIAYGLMLHLREAVPDAEWRVDGGLGSEAVSLTLPDGTPRSDLPTIIHTDRWPGGMVTPDRTWKGHFWVAGRMPCGLEIVVDLAADQFGYGDVVIVPADDPRYRSNLRRDVEDHGFTQSELAWGHGLRWAFWREASSQSAPGMR